MGTTLSRLQLAQRIQQLLLREIDHAIEVDRLLADARYARDVLLVCEAVPGGELIPLAALFRDASRTVPGAEAGGQDHPAPPTSQDWVPDTSGFGSSQPSSLGGPAGSRRASDSEPAPLPEPRRSWLPRWRDSKH